jgi:hypothetical protein
MAHVLYVSQQEVFAALQELDASDIDISVCVGDLMTLLEYCTRYTYTTSSTTTATSAIAAQSTLQLDATAVTNIAILMRMWEHPTATVRTNTVTALQYTLATATANATAAAPMQQQQQQATSAKTSAIVRAVLHRCLWGMLCDNDATITTTIADAKAGSSCGARAACLTAWQYFLDAAAATAVLQDSSNFSNLVQIAEGYYYTADDEQCLCPVYNIRIDSIDSDNDVHDGPMSKAAKTSHKATASRSSSGKSVTGFAVTVTRQHGTGATYASRALVRDAVVQLLHCSSNRSKKDDLLHTVVKHAVVQSQEAAYASQREAALLLLTVCICKWQQCDSDTTVTVQSETRKLISECIAALLTAVKPELTATNADNDSSKVSNMLL